MRGSRDPVMDQNPGGIHAENYFNFLKLNREGFGFAAFDTGISLC